MSPHSFTNAQATGVMGISERHTTCLKGEFKRSDANALVHKGIGVSPAHAVDEATRQEIVALKSTKGTGRHYAADGCLPIRLAQYWGQLL